jgi:hypothetical protein
MNLIFNRLHPAKLLAAAIAAAIILLLGGCVTTQHKLDPATGLTNTVFVPNPQFITAVESLKTVAPAVAGPWGELVAGLLTAITTGVTVYAYQKTQHLKNVKNDLKELKNNNGISKV